MEHIFSSLPEAWLGWGQATIALAGAVVAWLLSRAQSLGEIRKMQAELVSLRVSQFEKIIALDEKQRAITARMYEQLRQLLQALHAGDASAALKSREVLQQMFFLEYIGSYFHYASLGRWVFPEARYELVDDEIIPFLDTSALLLEALNQSDVLALTGQEPISVNDFDFNFAFRFARKHTRFWEIERKRRIDRLEARLLQNEGQSNPADADSAGSAKAA